MRWILDACTLIYLAKARLFRKFIELTQFPVVIDSTVYEEVVIRGKHEEHKDAFEIEKLLKEFMIPVISVDVSKEIYLFRDAGETSCYILAKDHGICITSDERAYKKFINFELNTIRLDTFFFHAYQKRILKKNEFMNILEQLETVNATKPKSILFFLEKLNQ